MSKEVILTVKADTKNAQSNVKDLNKDLKETKGDLSGVENLADKATGGLVSGFKGVTSTIGGVVKGFKTMRMAIIATGIGALVVVVSSLMAAFTSSEEGANKFNKILGVLGAVVDNFVDLLADLGEALINVFTNPVETLKNFSKSVKQFVTDRINGAIESLGILGGAIKKVFSGDFKGALKDAKDGFVKLNENINPVVIGIKAATKATKEFIEEQKRDAEGAARVADMRAKATKLERELLVERSKLESEIANLRLKSRQEEEFGVAERKQALLDAQKLEDQLLQKETEVLKLRRDAQVEENTFARSSVENLDKEAQAIAAVNRIAATRANQQRTTQRELNTLNKQIQAENKRIANEKKAQDDAAAKRKQEALKADEKARAIKKAADEKARAIKKAADEKAQKEELERAKKQNDLLEELTNTEQEQEIYKLKQQYKKKFELAKGNAELEKELREEQQKELSEIDKKFTEKTQQERLDAFEQGARTTMNALIAINELTQAFAKEDEASQKKAFEVNKAIGIANAIINTSVGVSKALASSPPPLNFINAGIVTALGVATVKNIQKTKFDSSSFDTTSPSTSGGSGGGATTSPTQAPSFNVVGQSGFNQVAGALGQQQPVQAFVVSGDVTTAQQLQNNTITQATF